MKLQKTLKIKIGKLSNNKENKLDTLTRKNTKAINFCLQKVKKGKYITHNLVYKDLRKLNLPATVIHGARAKSVEIIKSYYKRRGKKTFPILKNSKVRFDNQVVKLRKTNNKLYNWKNEFFRRQRGLLQQNFALQEIKRLKGRQTRYNNYYLNNIAKNIIEQAKQEKKPVIILENLKHILETTRVSKKQRTRLHSWIFGKLQRAIEYKANWEGIPVIYIKPNYSSQVCSKCGELNRKNKHIYKCKYCGFECNSDYNAGRNLQRLFLAKCQEERASINNASDCVKPESTKTGKDNIVRNLVQLEMGARILWLN